ncbi:hypothetical protein N7495_009253 [Penicillium taxi]|uniref:uncharacterized protein n=1 Tax=Penicillium taxi TaxID=168475 RepID=UPI00254589C7|nr:uncharacterized protein N7495_009253 [Penicillium taxi]KAJ5884743.1 hypothetical protein N7495_009253 [Penicillium taxi]
MLQYTINHQIEAFIDIIKLCIFNSAWSVEQCMRPTESDMNEIWRINHELPPTYSFCMHEMVSERAQKHPDKVAIHSWDGDLTYGEVDQYSSIVEALLRESGVEPDDVLPVCFEKSRWTIVAVLGVMKAGATFALMDPTLPLARLQNMAEQIGAKRMVCSRKEYDFSTSILPSEKLLVVEEQTFSNVSAKAVSTPASVPSSTLMYIIFTSGSTGTPKGVTISHQSYTSSAIPRAAAVGYDEDSRVLVNQDLSPFPILTHQFYRTSLHMLSTCYFISIAWSWAWGEAVSARDATLWGKSARIIIGYGPCECTIGCTVNSSAATGRDYISIGPGNGAAIWIVDPNDHNILMPIGAVGELLVEGPIVGQGYLNDPEKTASAFVRDPPWLVEGYKKFTGRLGRLYKTGDLGRYDPDGSGGIVFSGRKDTQVKLRGQRVELGEIESQLRDRLPSDANVIVEVIVPQGSGGQPTLVAFITSPSMKTVENDELTSVQFQNDLRGIVSKTNDEIAKVLPRYMIPTVYIPVNNIPVLISGKTDRKRLRQFGTTIDLRQVDGCTEKPAARELSEFERRLRQSWAQTLKLEEESIQPGDNFFALGGESLAAMRLVSICRAQGLDLSVMSTFNNPTLSAMAGAASPYNIESQTEIAAFSMISQASDSACLEASQTYGFIQSDIQDIYPCTATQESLITFSLKSVEPYIAQRIASIPSDMDIDILKKAWGAVVEALPILRTRLAQLQEPGLQQVVLKEQISWRTSTDLQSYLESDRNERMDLGDKLARYAIVHDANDGKRYMVWTIHHVVSALYDGWSEPLVLQQVSNVLQKKPIEVQTQMRQFVKWEANTDEEAMQEFWRRELKNAVGPQFPHTPSRDFLPNPDSMIERQISVETNSGSPFTMATLIRGAWALVASQYSGSDDVVFGETLTGRDIALPGVEGIVGPLIATVPVRIHIDRKDTIENYLQAMQQGVLARTSYQHMGMQNIRKVSQDAQHACEAPTGLVIQPDPEYVGSELGFEVGDVVKEALHFNPYPLMIGCGIRKGGFRICANFDSRLIQVSQMERVLAQMEMACSQLTRNLSRRLGDISYMPETELDHIWERNKNPPLSWDQSSKKLRANANAKQGSTYPGAVVPWVCNLQNPSLLSPIGCAGELWLEGAFFSGEVVESPAWLVSGSSKYTGRSGKVQSTGDVVKLREDGSLEFVGRKEHHLPVQGHAVNITDLEAHFSTYLSLEVRATAAVIHSQELQPELIVFLQQLSSAEATVQVIPADYEITSSTNIKAVIRALIPSSLSASLKKFDKFVHDSLPSYMVPSAYIVINELPTESEDIDYQAELNQLASGIPQEILIQLRKGFQETWSKTSSQSILTASEYILRSAWAKILRIEEEKIDIDDNFFRLGGDSVLAMKLVSNLRAQGHKLSVADIFQHMRLSDAARVLKTEQTLKENDRAYKPFSMLSQIDVGQFLSNVVRPKLVDPHWSIQDVYPVTDSQALDIKGTIQAPRTSIQYTMLFFEKGINRDQLLHACKQLVETHEILRTVFINHEASFYQVVLEKVNIAVTLHQVDEPLEDSVAQICSAESDFNLGSPFLKLMHIESNEGRECLALGLSHAQYDGVSLPRMLQDLETFYSGDHIADFKTFTSYMACIQDETLQKKAISYWSHLLRGSSLSVLETSAQPTDKAIFRTTSVGISPSVEHITTATLLTAAWAVVLARRLNTSDVTFGGVTSGRMITMSNAEDVVGPCYQLTPIRVVFESHWTPMDLFEFVQKQGAESAAHDFLGFNKISKNCVQWSSDLESFDSLVHHQDWDDFDTMPFAGGNCKVDILNPDGDGAYPTKTVSFVKDGQLHVGVVGSENDSIFVEGALAELAATVKKLVLRRSEGSLEQILQE